MVEVILTLVILAMGCMIETALTVLIMKFELNKPLPNVEDEDEESQVKN
jgi:hypothetical protein